MSAATEAPRRAKHAAAHIKEGGSVVLAVGSERVSIWKLGVYAKTRGGFNGKPTTAVLTFESVDDALDLADAIYNQWGEEP